MRTILIAILFSTICMAQPNLRQPTRTLGSFTLDASSTNILTSTYVEISAASAVTRRCKQLMFSNRTTSHLILALGASGDEVDRYVVPPSGGFANMDVHIPGGSRLSLQAIGSNATSGLVVVQCYF